MRILFAEDMVDMAATLCEVLHNRYPILRIDWLSDGDVAFKEFENHKYDLVITDLNMERKDGVWLAQKIRETNKSIPIILWTASIDLPNNGPLLFNRIVSNKDFLTAAETCDIYYRRWEDSKDV